MVSMLFLRYLFPIHAAKNQKGLRGVIRLYTTSARLYVEIL